MTSNEIEMVRQRFRARLEALLTPGQLALYDGYEASLALAIEVGSVEPVPMPPAVQAVFAAIAADPEARGLRAQLDILTRVDMPPQ